VKAAAKAKAKAAEAKVRNADIGHVVAEATFEYTRESSTLAGLSQADKDGYKSQTMVVLSAFLALDNAIAEQSFASATTNEQKAMAVAKLNANNAKLVMNREYDSYDADEQSEHQATLDRAEAV